MMTIAEVPEFIRRAEKLLSDEERRDLVDYPRRAPEGRGSDGGHRWGAEAPVARGGRGKSGGVRVIYYFHNEAMPLYLLTLFGKHERANLSKAERNELAKLVRVLVQTWIKR